MVGSGINHDEGCRIDQGEAWGQWHAQRGWSQGVGGKTASPGEAGHGLADLEVRDPLANRLNHPCIFRAGHKGECRLDLVLVLHNQQVRKIQASSMNFHQYLACTGLRGG